MVVPSKSNPKPKPKSLSSSKTSTLTLQNLSNKSQQKQRLHSLLTPPTFSPRSASPSQPPYSSASPSCPQTQGSQAAGPRSSFGKPLAPTCTKGKEREVISLIDDEVERSLEASSVQKGRLWVDLYQPKSLEELAVHKRKVQDVRQWLLESFKGGITGSLRRQRRILVLSGPAGTGKTATIRVLSRELGFDIMEWKIDPDEQWHPENNNFDYESISEKLDDFLSRTSAYSSILVSPPESPESTERQARPSDSQPSTSTHPPLSSEATHEAAGCRLLMIEDLPNISHAPTQSAFHDALTRFVDTKSALGTPLVVIVSDEGRRGADSESTGYSRNQIKVDIRSILPKSLLGSRYATEIKFNPVSSTLLKKALQSLLSQVQPAVLGSQKSEKEMIEKIIQNANGDIRSAIMSLEFICGGGEVGGANASAKKKRLKRSKKERTLLELTTQRESSLALFHLLGKVLYNKRKGDPSPSSASAREIQKEKEAEALIPDPPSLPPWHEHEFRRTSKVNPETLYSDSPIDTSLYSLYLHQNYPQFCDTEDQAFALCDWLSYVDSMGGPSTESYLWASHINPYQFHLVSLGTLHSLPSPVTRRNQKILKPSFFEWNSRRNDAAAAADEVAVWFDSFRSETTNDSGLGSNWGRKEIVCDTGAVLKAKWAAGEDNLPASFTRYAELRFVWGNTGVDGGGELDSGGEDGLVTSPMIESEPVKRTSKSGVVDPHSWLLDDDIED